jgi:hypothetical protein
MGLYEILAVLAQPLAQKQLRTLGLISFCGETARARVKIGDRHQIGAVKAAQRSVFCCAIWSLSPIFRCPSFEPGVG